MNKKNHPQSPSISRTIPAVGTFKRMGEVVKPILQSQMLGRILVVILTSILIVEGLHVYVQNKLLEKQKAEYQKVVQDVNRWEEIIIERPDYRDGYFKLATLYYRLKDISKAKEHLKIALEIDPNFEEGKKLEKILKQ